MECVSLLGLPSCPGCLIFSFAGIQCSLFRAQLKANWPLTEKEHCTHISTSFWSELILIILSHLPNSSPGCSGSSFSCEAEMLPSPATSTSSSVGKSQDVFGPAERYNPSSTPLVLPFQIAMEGVQAALWPDALSHLSWLFSICIGWTHLMSKVDLNHPRRKLAQFYLSSCLFHHSSKLVITINGQNVAL